MSRLENIARRIRNCRRCPLFKSALNAVPGEGSSHARIFFIGISPGSTEDKTGRPFSGRAGKFLDSVFKRL
ncbi:uracil-DNA glycosylase, partial [Candidatus Woesearchaeota archaeon ex4484_78]